MASSLAAALRSFPLFAGRLIIDADKDYAVNLTGAGASLCIAASDATLEDVLPKELGQSEKPGLDSAPIWHQYACAEATNCCFVLPAAAAAPEGGMLVHLILHRSLARELKKNNIEI